MATDLRTKLRQLFRYLVYKLAHPIPIDRPGWAAFVWMILWSGAAYLVYFSLMPAVVDFCPRNSRWAISWPILHVALPYGMRILAVLAGFWGLQIHCKLLCICYRDQFDPYKHD